MFAGNLDQMFAWNNDGSEHIFTFPGHVFPFSGTSNGGALYGQWFQSNGESGAEPLPYLKKIMENWRKGFGVPAAERATLCQEIWQLIVENVNNIGIVGPGPASMRVRVAKTDPGNIPPRQYNSADASTPGLSRPQHFFLTTACNRTQKH